MPTAPASASQAPSPAARDGRHRRRQGIVKIAIAKMSLAVREVSVENGYDPRDFALVAFGGAGPLHVMAIARDLHIPAVIVPLFPSHFSALGMLLADVRHDYVRTYYADLAKLDSRGCSRCRRRWRRRRSAACATRPIPSRNPTRHALRRSGVHVAGAGRPAPA